MSEVSGYEWYCICISNCRYLQPSQLISAVTNGDIATVTRILNKGRISVNIMDEVSTVPKTKKEGPA